MPKYIITNSERYQVEADSPEQALAIYRVVFDGIEPELVDLPEDVYQDPDQFEYLDGETQAVELEEDN